MVDPNDVRKAIITMFATHADRPDAFTPAQVVYDNETEPEDGSQPWARLVVRHTGREQASLGPVGKRLYDVHASVFIQFFTPAGVGSSEADEITNSLLSVFQPRRLAASEAVEGTEVSLSGDDFSLVFLAPQVAEGGQEGAENRTFLEAPFTYSERR